MKATLIEGTIGKHMVITMLPEEAKKLTEKAEEVINELAEKVKVAFAEGPK